MESPPKSRSYPVVVIVVGAGVIGAIGYFLGARKEPAPTPPSVRVTEAPATVDPIASASSGPDDVHPVYPMTSASASGPALALCNALYGVTLARKSACCGSTSHSTGFTPECARNVSAALATGTVQLDEKRASSCEAAMQKLHEGCDWVTPIGNGLPPPKECQGLLKGNLAAGARCHSGYECKEGLACHGAGPTAMGTCGPPLAQGSCDQGVDVLGTYLRDKSFDHRHPECTGYCSRHLCIPLVAIGQACPSDAACGDAARCIAGKCATAAPKSEGDACEGSGCDEGLRCLKGKCAKPHREGETCETNAECRGQCKKPTDGAVAACASVCDFGIKPKAPQ